MMIAAELRKTIAKQTQLNTRLNARLAQLMGRCKHTAVVIVRSYYEGSYIDDWTDGHGEERICLSCGAFESRDKGVAFNLLKHQPIAQMESSAFTYRLVMGMSLQKIRAYVKKHGYRVIT